MEEEVRLLQRGSVLSKAACSLSTLSIRRVETLQAFNVVVGKYKGPVRTQKSVSNKCSWGKSMRGNHVQKEILKMQLIMCQVDFS